MKTEQKRPLALVTSCPSLPRHVRLRFDPLRDAWALLSPEKVLWPDEISLAILKRCDGHTDLGAIAAGLALEYDADEDEIAADVLAFAQDWSDRMVLRL